MMSDPIDPKQLADALVHKAIHGQSAVAGELAEMFGLSRQREEALVVRQALEICRRKIDAGGAPSVDLLEALVRED